MINCHVYEIDFETRLCYSQALKQVLVICSVSKFICNIHCPLGHGNLIIFPAKSGEYPSDIPQFSDPARVAKNI